MDAITNPAPSADLDNATVPGSVLSIVENDSFRIVAAMAFAEASGGGTLPEAALVQMVKTIDEHFALALDHATRAGRMYQRKVDEEESARREASRQAEANENGHARASGSGNVGQPTQLASLAPRIIAAISRDVRELDYSDGGFDEEKMLSVNVDDLQGICERNIRSAIANVTGAEKQDARPHLTEQQIFEVAAPFFRWNAPEGWKKATSGTIGMTTLLAYTKAAIVENERMGRPANVPQ